MTKRPRYARILAPRPLPFQIRLFKLRPEDSGVTICYASVYGHTKEAAEKLAELLEAKGCASVSLFDLARDDMFEAIEDAFRYDRLVLASITYAMDIFPVMRKQCMSNYVISA